MAIVRYDNDMNTVHFRRFTAKEMDVFFALCYKLQDKGGHEVNLSFDEIKRLSSWNNEQSEARFTKALKGVGEKIVALHIWRTFKKEQVESLFNLFSRYDIDLKNKEIRMAVNPELADLFTQLMGNFTTFLLEDLSGITTTYGKELFRQIKQFRQQGELYMSLEDFRVKLSVPKSYTNGKMVQKIFTDKTISQLKKAMRGFHYKIYKDKRRGNAITGFRFYWDKEYATQNLDQLNERRKQIEKISG